jgi:hypothetical protein
MSVGLKLQDRDDISISDMLNAASALKKNQLVTCTLPPTGRHGRSPAGVHRREHHLDGG